MYVIMMFLLLVKSYDMPPCCFKTFLGFFADQIFPRQDVSGVWAACSTAWMTKPRWQPRPTLTSPCQTKCWITRRQANSSQQLTTKLSRSCHHTSSLLLLLESAAAAGGHPQASIQQSMIDSLYKHNALQTETALSRKQAGAAVASDKLLFAVYLTSLTQLQHIPSPSCIPLQCQPRVIAGA